jgi:hypothetical protein
MKFLIIIFTVVFTVFSEDEYAGSLYIPDTVVEKFILRQPPYQWNVTIGANDTVLIIKQDRDTILLTVKKPVFDRVDTLFIYSVKNRSFIQSSISLSKSFDMVMIMLTKLGW